jgi:hypothetical protein
MRCNFRNEIGFRELRLPETVWRPTIGLLKRRCGDPVGNHGVSKSNVVCDALVMLLTSWISERSLPSVAQQSASALSALWSDHTSCSSASAATRCDVARRIASACSALQSACTNFSSASIAACRAATAYWMCMTSTCTKHLNFRTETRADTTLNKCTESAKVTRLKRRGCFASECNL